MLGRRVGSGWTNQGALRTEGGAIMQEARAPRHEHGCLVETGIAVGVGRQRGVRKRGK